VILRLKRARHSTRPCSRCLRGLAADSQRRRAARAMRADQRLALLRARSSARGRSRRAAPDRRPALRGPERALDRRASACARARNVRSSASRSDDDWQYEIWKWRAYGSIAGCARRACTSRARRRHKRA
jgi:hypothetical protein